MNIYLDIDGVLLANDVEPANYVHEFLEFVTNKHPVYWLTTHCRGDAKATVQHLSRWLRPETLALASRIQETDWKESKTEAIDWSEDFLWFDDNLFDSEKKDLIEHGVLSSWVEVDLSKDVNQLMSFVNNPPHLQLEQISKFVVTI